MKITLAQARAIGNKLNINFNEYDINTWRHAMQVELEHGSIRPLTNVTNNDLLKTGKIALAHILEAPDYYERLIAMEKQADKYWANKKRPIVLKK